MAAAPTVKQTLPQERASGPAAHTTPAFRCCYLIFIPPLVASLVCCRSVLLIAQLTLNLHSFFRRRTWPSEPAYSSPRHTSRVGVRARGLGLGLGLGLSVVWTLTLTLTLALTLTLTLP